MGAKRVRHLIARWLARGPRVFDSSLLSALFSPRASEVDQFESVFGWTRRVTDPQGWPRWVAVRLKSLLRPCGYQIPAIMTLEMAAPI